MMWLANDCKGFRLEIADSRNGLLYIMANFNFSNYRLKEKYKQQ